MAAKGQLEKLLPAIARMNSPVPNPAPTSSRSNMPIGHMPWDEMEASYY